jgi:hypothetical protein
MAAYLYGAHALDDLEALAVERGGRHLLSGPQCLQNDFDWVARVWTQHLAREIGQHVARRMKQFERRRRRRRRSNCNPN